ncbi:multidrug efflux SMR transporter [Paenibacillus urinalis]|uniref:Multidrug efflux SMR transporter n=1 Tax=Paenibacillus urinalis TaxID=521520 RepID=A0AAX3MYC2_9BACL|nr:MULTISPECIES: multidrug efflux SMR transporter [Paenibacillus]WDH82317.1 multidrug efflux SMR transporter [Paenibacillus urinalis]WDH98345.1 multidrug efflux SMR transporter [Paenibacillus urinalis]WDI02035.1 multidrug efflux SMR transporter [Paenibacillus urinalis]GAK41330.1 small multidrug resistance protein [Paenibacillus sp. TCA20]
MAWAAVIFAGLSEILGVIGIKGMSSGKGKKYFLLMGISFLVSFSLLSYAMQSLSMGTAYAVWTGIGTVGSTIVGMFIFGEPKEAKRVLFIAMILCSAVGLKLIG